MRHPKGARETPGTTRPWYGGWCRRNGLTEKSAGR